jgi:arylsulfatase
LDRSIENAAPGSRSAEIKKGEKTMAEKPNILVIWGDDIGWQNVSALERI